MSAFLKTIPSAPTPGYFTSFRTFVDSIPDAGKDRRLVSCSRGEQWQNPTRGTGWECFPPLASQPSGIQLIFTANL